MTQPNDGEMIDVWIVSAIVFIDRDEAIEFAENVLSNIFEELEEEDFGNLTIERAKMTRTEYDELKEGNGNDQT
jgi:hypothetical protein